MKKTVNFFKTSYANNEIKAFTKLVHNGNFSMGKETINFEKAIAKKLKITENNVALVSNCTTGLHLSMIVTGVKQKQEVLCSSLTFVADANCIKYVGAKPQFIDISSNKNWNMSVNDIKKKN